MPIFENGRIYRRQANGSLREAGTSKTSGGYQQLVFDGRHYYVSRVLFAMYHGAEALDDLFIDHANRIRADNRIGNLRTVTPAQNSGNAGVVRANSSGYRGVSWHEGCHKWRAQIKVDGTRHLGLFHTAPAAARAYDAAAINHHGQYACTNEMLGLLDDVPDQLDLFETADIDRHKTTELTRPDIKEPA